MTRWCKNVLIASLVTAAAMAPEASAYLPEGTVDRVGSMYKVSGPSVMMVIGIFVLSLLLAHPSLLYSICNHRVSAPL
jgi:uncharacterized protein (DUF2236 family)